MAWTYFPVARGQRITAAMLNELRDACVERGMTLLGYAQVSGHSISTGKTFVKTIRDSIVASINTAAWVQLTYIDETTAWTVKTFTTASPGSSTVNPWTELWGSGITTWQSSNTSPLSAATLNEIYNILNMLLTSKGVTNSGIAVKKLRRRNDGATCVDALSNLDGTSWSTNGELVGSNGQTVRINDFESWYSFQWMAGNPWTFTCTPAITVSALRMYMRVLYVHYQRDYEAMATHDPKAASELRIRAGTSFPTAYDDLATWGTVLKTVAFDATTKIGPDAGEPYSTQSRYLDLDVSGMYVPGVIMVVHADPITPSDTDLCAIKGSAMYAAEEYCKVINSFNPYIGWNFSKRL